jgi:hypothetical protein
MRLRRHVFSHAPSRCAAGVCTTDDRSDDDAGVDIAPARERSFARCKRWRTATRRRTDESSTCGRATGTRRLARVGFSHRLVSRTPRVGTTSSGSGFEKRALIGMRSCRRELHSRRPKNGTRSGRRSRRSRGKWMGTRRTQGQTVDVQRRDARQDVDRTVRRRGEAAPGLIAVNVGGAGEGEEGFGASCRPLERGTRPFRSSPRCIR